MPDQYVDAVFKSDVRFLKGFLQGYLAASGKSWRFFIGSEAGIATDSLAVKLKELIGLSQDHQHVIIELEFLKILRGDAAAAAQVGLSVEQEDLKPITAGAFFLRVKDASREDAAAIRGIIRDKSQVLVTSEWQEKEQVHEEGHGVELYTPLHDYVYQASGLFSGEISALIDLRQKLQLHTCAETALINLRYE